MPFKSFNVGKYVQIPNKTPKPKFALSIQVQMNEPGNEMIQGQCKTTCTQLNNFSYLDRWSCFMESLVPVAIHQDSNDTFC